MIVFLNGRFVPREEAVVSVFDRGFLYGDGLFETLPFYHGRPFRWAAHLERMRQGAEFLGLRMPFSADDLRNTAAELLGCNGLSEAMLRITLTRGVGSRGYLPSGADAPCLVMSVTAGAAPPTGAASWSLATSRLRLPTGDPLAAFKTANKLPQVLARVEATAAGADEALLLNTAGRVAEGSSSNLFWIAGGQVWTPPLTEGALGGVTRAVVLELCGALGIPLGERGLAPAELRCAAGVFLTLSTHGIVVARSLDGQPLAVSPLVDRIRRAYWEAVAAECNPGSTLSP